MASDTNGTLPAERSGERKLCARCPKELEGPASWDPNREGLKRRGRQRRQPAKVAS